MYLVIVLLIGIFSGCVGEEKPGGIATTEAPVTTSPSLTPAPDTTPPSAITGLTAMDAYDGKVVLSWSKSTAGDFSHYNIYASKSEIASVGGMTPVHQLRDVATNTYQVTGLQIDTKYYFSVTAADKSGNENKLVASVSATPASMPRGTSDPEIYVDVYRSDKACAGTTLLPDNHNPERPRIIEVNMLGEIIWEYLVPKDLRQYNNPGFDVERLPNDNVLFVLPRKGVYEINRKGDVVWSYLDTKISHDADRLPNGNTIFVFGAYDQISDAQVKEVNPKGEIVWAWYAKDHFNKAPYKDIQDEGWTHTNAVTRLQNGNTLISPRNFNFLVEVDYKGSVVRTIGEGLLEGQHDPEVLPNGNILLANHRRPHTAVEIDSNGKIVWQHVMPDRGTWPVRDANRLPNGNTLITGTTKIIEVTGEGEIVWQLALKGVTFEREKAAGLGFYKAERISPH
ncbi:MAG: aryl-sulfate sulfotransferase [Euryarchaeota archaeon]|nr:aryl-sulfate sulfotransferase [Euryarchaeota archaeon]